ncbi:MAG: dihydropteroate synthase [Elusimicrobia bacterium]|nr:MAG: dihydropteroate synthase [Elusimicrobiota bacterium]
MGIINATPDSFFAGGRADPAALGGRLAAEGADILDIGGQSTRPGSESVSEAEELQRVIPVIEALASKTRIPISIDTSKSVVADAALAAGATILNDITALRGSPDMPEIASRFPLVVLMHMLGESPRTMQADPRYSDVVGEISSFLKSRMAVLETDRVWIDPGIGFGKTVEHNLEILKGLETFAGIAPVLVGASRKSFIGKLLGGIPVEERLCGSLAIACRAAQAGAVCVRVHDVKETIGALDVWKRSS